MERTREAALAIQAQVGPEEVPWEQLLDTIVDAFVMLDESDPSFRAVSRNLHLYEVYAEDDQALAQELIERTAQVIGAYIKDLSARRRRLVATMLVNTVTASLFFTRQSDDPKLFKGIIGETKLMLKRYLAPYVEK